MRRRSPSPRRPTCTLTAIFALGVALAAPTAASVGTRRASSRTCGPAKGQTLLRSRHARVWRGGYRVTHACLFGVGRQFDLDNGGGTPSSGTGSGAYALAGRFVAYGFFSPERSRDREIVLDLTTGTVVREVFAGVYNQPPISEEAFLATVRSVLKPDGAVAWSSEDNSTAPRTYEVWRSDRGRTIMLDDGQTVDPRSLRLRGSTLTWNDGGVVRSASLR
jgi:hypothetical protein